MKGSAEFFLDFLVPHPTKGRRRGVTERSQLALVSLTLRAMNWPNVMFAQGSIHERSGQSIPLVSAARW